MRLAALALAVTALTVLVAGCPRGGASAEPAKVEIDWPDAGVVVAPVDAASPAD